MSEQNVLSPDSVTGLEGGAVTCEDVTIKLSTSLPILEGCLTATCDKWENGKSISSIDTGSASMPVEHGAKTDSDLVARPPGGDHPATQQASSGVLEPKSFCSGVLSSPLSYWARTMCHVTYLSDRDATRPAGGGPPTSSRHYGVGPTTTVGVTIV